ncbi:carbonic anhydrase [Alkalicoccobacillus gibsonii]|uniref:carbonic anhydrase n=1 Tax=Alkalicoccobacillus gibsonii TaxID=79881 RepID=UPI0013E75312|nr:carbonic anhydrase family protein [Alkalicoccobacillus gibsonii]MBM0066198.1 carbonic anhydrase family protein [Alkalicoccobacillus gibsonii]
MKRSNLLIKTTVAATILLTSTSFLTEAMLAHGNHVSSSSLIHSPYDRLTANASHDWSYSGPTGPEFWGELDSEFKACSNGTQQSPIALDPTDVGDEKWSLDLDYAKTEFSIENNGHTIQANVVEKKGQPSNQLTLGDSTYELVQFHFHSPSEHTLAGESYEMEVHLVHKDEQDNLAVLGVLMEEGEKNKALKDMWKKMPTSVGTSTKTIKLNPSELVPTDLSTFQYDGSLTTPPCSEGVKWSVSDSSITLSSEQLQAFQDLYPNNYRPIQDLGDREVGFHY